MIGNPVISCTSADYNAIQFDLFYWHGLVSYVVYANWTQHGCDQDSSQDGCAGILGTAIDQIGVIYQQKRSVGQEDEPSLDPDCLYQDFCIGNGTLDFTVNQGYPNACAPVGDLMTAYLNRDDVQRTIGAMRTSWVECSNIINYTPSGDSMIPLYKDFFAQRDDLSIMIYSGDVDIYTVPFGYTKACLAELDETVVSTWQPWFVNGATAGYVEEYEHITYATVKGGGHETPQYQPLISLNLFQRFLTKQRLTGKEYSPRALRHGIRRTEGRVLKEYGIRG